MESGMKPHESGGADSAPGESTTALILPSEEALVQELDQLAVQVDSIRRYLAAFKSGSFTHPDGRTDALQEVALDPRQAALIAYLAARCPSGLSAEVGFGMGSSAAVILGARRLSGEPFEHFIFDPYGLPGGRGRVVQAYLEGEFGAQFRRVEERSEVGLARLLGERGEGSVGFVFIDGAHHFENVMVDFALADLLCCRGGYIVFDDACFAAIETVVNYVKRNRPDYAVAHLPVAGTSVIQKVSSDERQWYAFTPFEVPARSDWNVKTTEVAEFHEVPMLERRERFSRGALPDRIRRLPDRLSSALGHYRARIVKPLRGRVLRALARRPGATRALLRLRMKKGFAGADLRGLDMRGLNLRGVSFRQANLAGALLDGSVFEADVSGAILRDASIFRVDLLELPAGFELRGVKLRDVRIGSRTRPVAVCLRGADLRGAHLRGADLRNADLRGVDLCDADLRDAILEGADLGGRANLQRAKLSGARLYGANLASADLTGADLREANLGNANLSGADLQFADLTGADLRGAVLDDLSIARAAPT
jgi:uncharacterized protein YjbI with pentapeptide repeats